jgi:enterochelin esterase-like enzyme
MMEPVTGMFKLKKFIVMGLMMVLMGGIFPAAAQEPVEIGRVRQFMFESEILGENFYYSVYEPAGYEDSDERYPVLYALHGRGDSMAALEQLKVPLDYLIGEGFIKPLIVVMPDVPWSDGGSYYVDSAYTGYPPGRPVETAFFDDLIPHIDEAYRTLRNRDGRIIGGYSMGGYGTIRYSLAYPDVFGSAIVLSPAVYTPLPPQDSSAREFGAFGKADVLFDEAVYQALNYPALLETFAEQDLPVKMFIAVGDDEYKNPNPDEALHDIDMEAHLLFNRVVRVENIAAELRVYEGGHTWDVWQRGFAEGLRWLIPVVK